MNPRGAAAVHQAIAEHTTRVPRRGADTAAWIRARAEHQRQTAALTQELVDACHREQARPAIRQVAECAAEQARQQAWWWQTRTQQVDVDEAGWQA